MEECCLYIIQNISSNDFRNEYQYRDFFELSINLFAKFLADPQRANLNELTSSISGIIERINLYFASGSEEDDENIMDELTVFSKDLKSYFQELKKLLIKTETLSHISQQNYMAATTKY